MATYSAAPAVAEVAHPLIAAHHSHLSDVPIVYIFRDPAAVARGRVVLGRARRVAGLNAFLAALAAGEAAEDDAEDHSFFVMEIALEEWEGATRAERAAVVDHELCHFGVTDEGDLEIRGHDLEEFDAVVRRHGLWREDVARFAGSCSAAAACAVAS